MSKAPALAAVALLLLSLSPRPGRAEEPAPAKVPKLVMAGLKATGPPAAEVEALSESLCTEAAALKGVELLCSSELKVLLEHQSNQRLLGCETEDCVQQLGGLVQADWLLVGSVGKIGETHTLNLRLLDATSAKVLGRVTRKAGADIAGLLEELGPALQELWGARPKAKAPTPAK